MSSEKNKHIIKTIEENHRKFNEHFDELIKKYQLFQKFVKAFGKNPTRNPSFPYDSTEIEEDPFWMERAVFYIFSGKQYPKTETINIIHELMFDEELRKKILETKPEKDTSEIMIMLSQCLDANDQEFSKKSCDEKVDYMRPLIHIMVQYPVVYRDMDIEYFTNCNGEEWLGESLKYFRELLMSYE
jgi:hypothetical protein